MIQMKIKKTKETAQLPVYATDGSGCFDMFVASIERRDSPATAVYSLGLSVEFPKGWVLALFSRSGHGFKKDIRLSNAVAIIDSDYRGDIQIKLRGDGKNAPAFTVGDRIVQGMLIQAPRVEFLEVEELGDSERGEGGFGSTGN